MIYCKAEVLSLILCFLDDFADVTIMFTKKMDKCMLAIELV